MFAAIKSKAVQHLHLPHYETLTVDKLRAKWFDDAQVKKHLPDPEDHEYLPRQWTINVLFTVLNEPFAQWARQLCEERNELRKKKANEEVELHPDIFAAFQKSSLSARKYLFRPL